MSATIRCLVLACGNTLRTDDGIGPWLAHWIEENFSGRDGLKVIAQPQWTPDLAEDLAQATQAIFLDCAVAGDNTRPGEILLSTVYPADMLAAPGTHHLDAAELLALAAMLYGAQPAHALQLTVAAGSLALGEGFSPAVTTVLPVLRRVLGNLLEESLTLAAR
jgi:hydrogenase maturation protease